MTDELKYKINITVHFLKDIETDIYITGGTVRDYLTGKAREKIGDIDLTVKGDSHKVACQIAEKINGYVVPVGGEFNITRVALPNKMIGYDIRGFNNSIEEDLAKRDFTINALAINLKKWNPNHVEVIGNDMGCIASRTLYPVSDTIFKDDGVRLLRAFRLWRQFNFRISGKLERMIIRDKNYLLGSANERITSELLKIMSMDDSWATLISMDTLGLLGIIFPELEKCKDLEQPKDWHIDDVFHHSLNTVRNLESIVRFKHRHDIEHKDYFDLPVSDGVNRFTLLKLAALLHDIGKAETQTIDKDGDIHFYGHEKIGADMVRNRLFHLKLSKHSVDRISKIVRFHMVPHELVKGVATPKAILRFYRKTLGFTLDTLFLGMADRLAHRWKGEESWAQYAERIKDVWNLQDDPRFSEPLRSSYANGNTIMSWFDLKPGPIIGDILNELIEAEACGQITNDKDAFNHAKWYISVRNK